MNKEALDLDPKWYETMSEGKSGEDVGSQHCRIIIHLAKWNSRFSSTVKKIRVSLKLELKNSMAKVRPNWSALGFPVVSEERNQMVHFLNLFVGHLSYKGQRMFSEQPRVVRIVDSYSSSTRRRFGQETSFFPFQQHKSFYFSCCSAKCV